MRLLTLRLWLAHLAGLPDVRAHQADLERHQTELVDVANDRTHAAAAGTARAIRFIDEHRLGDEFRMWLFTQPAYDGRVRLAPPTFLPAEMLLGTEPGRVWAFDTEENALRWWAAGGRQVFRVRLAVIESLDGVRWKERVA